MLIDRMFAFLLVHCFLLFYSSQILMETAFPMARPWLVNFLLSSTTHRSKGSLPFLLLEASGVLKKKKNRAMSSYVTTPCYI